tara:strand:- start:127439 stop:128677 length:1239 start_codon:yes stop_codon:yes gene_type:complete
MLGLSQSKYSPVFCRFKKALPVILNKKYIKTLESLGNKLSEQSNKNDFSSPLDALCFESILPYQSNIASAKEYDQQLEKSDFQLKTERFYGKHLISIGSSRHALFDGFQFKGVGRNLLAISDEYEYGWGGYRLDNIIDAFIKNEFLKKNSLIEPLNLLGAFVFDDMDRKNGLVIREANTFRLAQIAQGSLNRKDLKFVRNWFDENVKKNPEENLRSIIKNFINLKKLGITCMTPSYHNLTLCGRPIDSESYDIKINDTFCAELQLLKMGERIFFFDSWVHQVYLPCFLTNEVYSEIFEINFDFKQYFAQELTLAFGDIAKRDLEYLNYPSLRQLKLIGEGINELSEYTNELGESYEESFHSDINASLLKFSASTDDSYINLCQKLKLLLFNKKDFDFNMAIERFTLIEMGVK